MEYLKRYRRTKSLDGKKIPLSERSTGRLWDLTYQALATAFLMGMSHVGERLEMAGLVEISPKPLSFEEALSFFRARVPLTREEWDELEAKLRFRAFIVARLTELDAVNCIREKLLKVIEEGKTFRQFMAEAGEDELLRKAGFHRSNPWYWETVFRTNIQTAYNAGRKMQLSRDPHVLYYEFVDIRDSRQTEMCRRRTGVIRPAGDPWWSRNWPPLHFNCRSTVRAIYREEAEARSVRVTRSQKLESLPPPQEGFGLDPISAGTFWRITPLMIERAQKYGILGEIERLARELGLVKIVMDETSKFIPEKLIKVVGQNLPPQKEPGETLDLGSGLPEAKVIEIYRDLLGNHYYLADLTWQHIETSKLGREIAWLKTKLPSIFGDPDYIFWDVFEEAIIYVKKLKGIVGERLYCVVVGREDRRIFTVLRKGIIFQNKIRYKELYRK